MKKLNSVVINSFSSQVTRSSLDLLKFIIFSSVYLNYCQAGYTRTVLTVGNLQSGIPVQVKLNVYGRKTCNQVACSWT